MLKKASTQDPDGPRFWMGPGGDRTEVSTCEGESRPRGGGATTVETSVGSQPGPARVSAGRRGPAAAVLVQPEVQQALEVDRGGAVVECEAGRGRCRGSGPAGGLTGRVRRWCARPWVGGSVGVLPVLVGGVGSDLGE